MSLNLNTEDLAKYLVETQSDKRRIIAIAGAPGSGKSKLSHELRKRLDGKVSTAILPMDGFHFDDEVLNSRGHLARKGAPHTFDVNGYFAALARLSKDDGCEVAIPIFDRSIEIAKAGARIIGPQTRLILTEGNYLLLNDPDWLLVRQFFDETIFIETSEKVLEQRLYARWNDLGFEEESIMAKLEGNDFQNVRLVMSASSPANIIIKDYV